MSGPVIFRGSFCFPSVLFSFFLFFVCFCNRITLLLSQITTREECAVMGERKGESSCRFQNQVTMCLIWGGGGGGARGGGGVCVCVYVCVCVCVCLCV